MRRSLAATAIVVLCGCGGGGAADPSSERFVLRPIGSVERAPLGYLEYLPPAYGDGRARPLLVFLHGSDESGDGTEATLRKVLALGIPRLIADDAWPADRDFVVLAPQYSRASAGECHHADTVDAFLDFAVRRYEVDAERVYLTGISCGSIGIWDYLGAHGDEAVAAAVPIAGHAVDAFATAGCELGRVPVWAFHGAVDPIVPEEAIARPIDELERCTDASAAQLRLTIYADAGHDAWTRTYDLSAGHDVYAWLLDQRRDS